MRKEKYIITFLLVICFSLLSIRLSAQDDYMYEVGTGIGTAFYMGDANKSKLYQNPGIAGGIVFRYNKDLRWSVKNNFVFGKVSGDTKNADNKFPFNEQASFNRMFYELGSQIEFNFFNYSDKFGYLGAKRMTPYIFTGVGVTFGSGNRKFLGANVPLGLGLKYKVKNRVNIGLEFSFRKLFSDSFDVTDNKEGFSLDNPYDIKGSVLKNNDWYSLTMLSITWDFGTRICPCLNID